MLLNEVRQQLQFPRLSVLARKGFFDVPLLSVFNAFPRNAQNPPGVHKDTQAVLAPVFASVEAKALGYPKVLVNCA